MANENSVMAVIRASRPSFRSSHDKVVFAVHSFFLANGYSLTATGRAVDETPSSSSSQEVGIDGWNESEDRYGFVYKKADGGSKKTVVVKCLALGDKLAVDALRVGDGSDEPVNLQIFHTGPNDPRFGVERPNSFTIFLHRGVPPGARFDPYGPPGVSGFEPNRFVRYASAYKYKYL
ncbi:putative proteasome inhibitor [Acorus gramineus]|uniref:Proteasome inhibitor n=1 Tax=Acorus gramineus TaxID=55184 RepID=A0AAV9A8U4_ACOGR|nr:putative proteasome inhibitor [Acorus gramineus]